MMNIQTSTLNTSLAENINYLLGKAGVNATELARRTGLPAATIKTLRHGDNVNPTLATLLAIAKFFSVTVSQLIGEEKLCFGAQSLLSEKSLKYIPILSWDDVAYCSDADVKERQCITVDDAEVNVDFALRIEQDGLDGFPCGTVLLVKSNVQPKNQDIVIIQKAKHTNIMLKQFLDEGDGRYLKSLFLGYPVVACNEEHRVVGVVRAIKRILNQFSKE